MITINDTLASYSRAELDKAGFIRSMYEQHHAKLFDYADHLRRTNIKKIEIEDGQVIMTTRDRGLRVMCSVYDFRVAPIETLNFFDYEINEAAMLERLISDGDVFLDIGANIGWYSMNVALSRRGARVHAFEPIPKTYQYLQQNLALNQIANVQAHNFGFSNQAGCFDFYYYDEGSGNASSANVSGRSDVQVVQCKVHTLDDFSAAQELQVDFIKCDVEGAELLVFKGGKATISRDLPIVFSEVLRKWSAKFNYNPNQIFEFFHDLGYRAFTVQGDHLCAFVVMDELTLETNFFFLHQDKHAATIRRWEL